MTFNLSFSKCFGMVLGMMFNSCFVTKAFETVFMDSYVSKSLTILILKGDNPQKFKEFRSTDLCNMTCMLVSKVVVNRLRSMLNDVVNIIKNSFITGRMTIDNAIILYDFIYHIYKYKMAFICLILRKLMMEWIGISFVIPYLSLNFNLLKFLPL